MEDSVEAAEAVVKDRKALRSAIFASRNKQTKRKLITMFGEEVELRQPTLQQIAKMSENTGSKIPPIVRIIIEYCYVPGTDDRVFDTADAEQIASMPSGKWLSDFNQTLQELTGVDVAEAEKNSGETD